MHDLFIDLTIPNAYTFADLWTYRTLEPGTTASAPGGWWLLALDAWSRMYSMAFGRRITLDTLDARLAAIQ